VQVLGCFAVKAVVFEQYELQKEEGAMPGENVYL
jgi:hypothetical protein